MCTGELKLNEACDLACADGYKVDADSIGSRSCNAQGMTTDDLVCVADGCLPNAEKKPDDENGLIGTCSGKLDIGASCSLACEDGYEMVTSEMSS